MDFHGFSSIKEYEKECARLGFKTERVPFHKDKKMYFVLVTTPPNHPNGTSVEAWHLFTVDERREVLEGIVSDAYIKDLAKNGYHQVKSERGVISYGYQSRVSCRR